MNTIIECQNLTKFYGSKKALNNVSFTCQEGEPIALVGPNGAGKTTLFSIFCHYFTASSGTVRLLGHELGDKALFGQVAALPQDAQLDPAFSISRQLRFFAELQGFKVKAARVEALRVLELMDLSQVANALPAALSHGMRKRAAIAQALIGNPKLVLLDEPTAGLDPANARNIRQQIAAISSMTTFMISSHNLQELERLCDAVLYLEQGCLEQQSHLSDHVNDREKSTLTVHVDKVERQLFINTIKVMPSVDFVSSDQRNEFVITYDATQQPNFDQQLLKLMAEQQWGYRRLIKGKTLEEQLFS